MRKAGEMKTEEIYLEPESIDWRENGIIRVPGREITAASGSRWQEGRSSPSEPQE